MNTQNTKLEDLIAESQELIDAIREADRKSLYIPELAERAFGVAAVLERLCETQDSRMIATRVQ